LFLEQLPQLLRLHPLQVHRLLQFLVDTASTRLPPLAQLPSSHMAHFAELDENNVVLRVIVVHNNDTHDVDGVEDEALGQAFCTNLLGGNWKQTSYNGKIRKNYAGTGYIYDPVLDEFVPPSSVMP
jgi:hypothetical protein